MQADYVESEQWCDCVPPRLLAGLSIEEFGLLHRHWTWASYQRTLFEKQLGEWDGEFEAWHLANEGWGTMLLWYGLLWAVIEAFEERKIQLGGPFQDDLAAVSDDLRRCRNAVFHVPKGSAYVDQRITAWIERPDSAARIRRISRAFGRLFCEEMSRRDGLE